MLRAIFLYLLYLIVTLNVQSQSSNHSIMIRAGYGGIYTYKGKDLTNITDNNRYAIDWTFKNKYSLTISYDKPFLYEFFSLKEITFAAKYYPFTWFNQPFIGVSYSMGTYKYGDEKNYPFFPFGEGKHRATGINWGLNIQFPYHFYIIFEANNIFKGYTGIIDATQTMIMNGTIGYKFILKKNEIIL